ncbi:efflux RND transporter periplasmic adaptor subunit [bacterium]|nr:efflux RND transporter periplasmic adaptor subunit [bacterium]
MRSKRKAKIPVLLILIIFVVGILLIIAIGAIIKYKNRGVSVRVEKVEKREIESVVTGFGRVQPTMEVEISAKVSGEIMKLFVEEGDTVMRGDTLVEVDRSRYAAQLEQAYAALSSARANVTQVELNLKQAMDNLERIKELYGKDYVAEKENNDALTQTEILKSQLQSAKDGVLRAQGVLNEAKESYNETIIISPQNGIVTYLPVEEGEFVVVGVTGMMGSVIMTIAQLTEMEAEIEVDETDIVNVRLGQEAELDIDAFPDTTYTGYVIQIGNKARVSGQGTQGVVANFLVKLSIEDQIPGLRPGMSLSADIITNRSDSAISVPIQAVVPEKKETIKSEEEKEEEEEVEEEERKGKPKEIVFIVEDNIAKARYVKTGISGDRYIEIKEGLEKGETIVVGSYKVLRELKDGQRVKTGKPKWGIKVKSSFD